MTSSPVFKRTIASPLGPIELACIPQGLTRVHLAAPGKDAKRSEAQIDGSLAGAEDADGAGAAHPLLSAAAAQLAAYFAGNRRVFELRLAPHGTAFQRRVWQALTDIPYGTTRSYQQLAIRLGRPNASRAVGLANSRNPIAIIVPCHRVIGADGSLTGYAGGIAAKRWLLAHEHALGPEQLSLLDAG